MTYEQEAEFTALVQRQSRFVYRIAYAVLLNSHDAEDAVQETFLKLYRNPAWQQADNERAWLARVTWRTAVDRRRANPAVHESPDQALDLPSPHPGPEQSALVSDQHALVHRMIDRLPEDLRLPLVLSAFEEFNSRQIGDLLGVPEGTIRTRLQRARHILRERLGNFQHSVAARRQEKQHA